MHKETSSRVSSLAAQIIGRDHVPGTEQSALRSVENLLTGNVVSVDAYNQLLDDAKTLAGSCMSQDETPGNGKPAGDFLSRLKDERADLERRLGALNSYLTHNPGHPNPRHNAMLTEQARLMSELLAVLDERLADLEKTDAE